MRKNIKITHEFVDHIPESLEELKVYVSIPFTTIAHMCPCGCGNEVVTPLSPADWKLIYDGETISVTPSIGNWSFDCKSHYWIDQNEIIWSRTWSQKEINSGRINDQKKTENHYKKIENTPEEKSMGMLSKISDWFKKLKI